MNGSQMRRSPSGSGRARLPDGDPGQSSTWLVRTTTGNTSSEAGPIDDADGIDNPSRRVTNCLMLTDTRDSNPPNIPDVDHREPADGRANLRDEQIELTRRRILDAVVR